MVRLAWHCVVVLPLVVPCSCLHSPCWGVPFYTPGQHFHVRSYAGPTVAGVRFSVSALVPGCDRHSRPPVVVGTVLCIHVSTTSSLMGRARVCYPRRPTGGVRWTHAENACARATRRTGPRPYRGRARGRKTRCARSAASASRSSRALLAPVSLGPSPQGVLPCGLGSAPLPCFRLCSPALSLASFLPPLSIGSYSGFSSFT